MKKVLEALYYQSRRELTEMQKSKMSLTDRVHYEKALTNLEAMKLIIDQSNF